MRKTLLLGAILLSAALTWFAVSNYSSARPVAEENLRGLALSFTSAIETIAVHDPSLLSLAAFQSHEIAYITIVDRNGFFRFHTNPDLIGKPALSAIALTTIKSGATSDERITLRTGEHAFQFNAPLYLPGQTLALGLTLHTFRADTVIRRARLNMMVLFSLMAGGWGFALVLYRQTRREERHVLEMARRESLAQLGEMGAMLAHEIRNPLAGIKGYAQVIEQKPMEERNSRFAGRIVVETLRLEALVNDLLTYARTDQDVQTAVNLGEVICHAAELLQPDAENCLVRITCECPDGLRIFGNQDRLGQVLLNLGKNAIQAMPEGGTLTVTAELSGNQVIVKVIDNGRGIGQEEMQKIFEPFFTTKAKGTGLGLALCRKIVENHGGHIELQSVVGVGTAVSITFPKA